MANRCSLLVDAPPPDRAKVEFPSGNGINSPKQARGSPPGLSQRNQNRTCSSCACGALETCKEAMLILQPLGKELSRETYARAPIVALLLRYRLSSLPVTALDSNEYGLAGLGRSLKSPQWLIALIAPCM